MTEKTMRTDSGMDMLHGPLISKIITFALPLMASGILQQSFNSVDVAVVGRYASHHALAAVGSNGMIISIMVNLFVGISVGANVVIANYIGRGNIAGIRKAISTVGSIAVLSGIFLLLVGVFAARPILEMMDTPPEIIDLATLYLRIYFLGMPFMMIYNFGSAVLRSLGDTKRPFYILVAGGIVNVLLNLLLVIGFGMSVDGVAIATVAANAVNAAIILYILRREQDPYRMNLRHTSIFRTEFAEMLRIGVPAGVQGMIFSFANIFIQSSINRFGPDAVAGSAAALNYEYYCFFVISAFAQAAVAFTGQNFGAGNRARCRKVFIYCMTMSFISCGSLNIFIAWHPGFFLQFFTDNPEVIIYGTTRLRYVLMFQFIASSYEIAGAAMRGFGYSMTPMLLTVFGTCVLRLGWIYTVCRDNDDFPMLLTVYPLSWVITGIITLAAYYYLWHRTRNSVTTFPVQY